jgi:protein SCO1/2
MRRNVFIAIASITLVGSSMSASAHDETNDVSSPDVILPPPPTYKGNEVTVAEHVGAKVPLDAAFRTSDGKHVTLGEVIRGSELPVILTFNCSDCPMLCSVQLNGLTAALPLVAVKGPGPDASKGDVSFKLGAQFRLVTIDLEPKESLDKLSKMRQRYLDRLPESDRALASTGWTFLAAATPGDDASIRRVAEAVGFRYTYLPEQAQWAHPAALIFLSAAGAVTRYVYGIEFEPGMMRESIYKAGLAEPATAVGFMNRCYHFDPDANSHTHGAVIALRVAAAGSVIALLAIFGLWTVVKRSKRAGVNR